MDYYAIKRCDIHLLKKKGVHKRNLLCILMSRTWVFYSF